MESLLGNKVAVFVWVTLIIHGGASLIMGRALATTWRPWWQAVLYGALLAASARFLDFALFQGPLLSGVAYIFAVVILVALALFAYRMTWADKMVRQYPWIYEKVSLVFVIEKGSSSDTRD